jgi:CheY-like chemotaxis protein
LESKKSADSVPVRRITRNSPRLLRLVNSLLDFSRLEAGGVPAHYESTDLAGLTRVIASSFRPAIERAGLSFAVDCPTLPEPIYVDREMWEKIVLNLLSNAFKHTFEGGIAVHIAWLGEKVRLVVEDGGIGIAEEEVPRLFERFHRVKGAASRSHEGSGIGLSMVREVVQLHAGSIQVDSQLGRGSRFVVTLNAGSAHLPADKIGPATNVTPVVRGVTDNVNDALHWLPSELNPQAEAENYCLDGEKAVEPAVPMGARARVLWADDNSDMREYVARLLRQSYDVQSVPDGLAALDAALASPPDLVLSDVMMPHLDGFGLLKALRENEVTRGVPIILLSARAGEESAIEGLDTRADDYLVKPFSARELLARVPIFRLHDSGVSGRPSWSCW